MQNKTETTKCPVCGGSSGDLAHAMCCGGLDKPETTPEELENEAKKWGFFLPRKRAEIEAKALNLGRWDNPRDWNVWKARLIIEHDLHGNPFGDRMNPEDYREFFDENMGPHATIEETFNDGGY